jgi:hypothetical protein
MCCVGQVVSDSCHCSNQVGTGSQMSNVSKILVGMPFLWQGVFSCVTMSKNLCKMTSVWFWHLHLKELSLSWTLNKSSFELKTCANVSLDDLIKSLNIFRDDNLKCLAIKYRTWRPFNEDPSLTSMKQKSLPPILVVFAHPATWITLYMNSSWESKSFAILIRWP